MNVQSMVSFIANAVEPLHSPPPIQKHSFCAAHFFPEVTSNSGEVSLTGRDFIALMMDKELVMKEDNLRLKFEHFKNSDPNHIVISDIVELVG